MQALRVAFGQGVGDHLHALPFGCLFDPQGEGDAMMPLTCQKRRQMFVLAGEILMDEKDFHGCPHVKGQVRL